MTEADPPSMSSAPCPLCVDEHVSALVVAHGRRYLRCASCELIFMHPADRLGPAAERARYETHENSPDDPGYRAFLDRIATPLAERLEPGARGLDYGAGPGPTLSVMLAERGFPTEVWDPFFAPDPAPLARSHDFVTCTETVEHFFDPAREFERFRQLVRPGGILAIMTEWVPDDFADWYYIRDPTHTCFWTPATFEWIARQFRWSVEFPRRNVAFLWAGVVRRPGVRQPWEADGEARTDITEGA